MPRVDDLSQAPPAVAVEAAATSGDRRSAPGARFEATLDAQRARPERLQEGGAARRGPEAGGAGQAPSSAVRSDPPAPAWTAFQRRTATATATATARATATATATATGKTRPREEARAETTDGALAAAPPLAPWQITDGPPRAPPTGRAAGPLPTAAVERLLLGFGPQGAEVRLRIGHGALAGTEIHLRQLPGGIEAVVLTRVESSRQTLAVAMAEVARRLQRKGYAFRAQARDPPRGGP